MFWLSTLNLGRCVAARIYVACYAGHLACMGLTKEINLLLGSTPAAVVMYVRTNGRLERHEQ